MSDTLDDSVHDFFENRTVTENGETLDKCHVDNGWTAYSQNRGELIEAECCTSRSDILIEGYVIINMLDMDKTVYSSSDNSKDSVVSTTNSNNDTANSQNSSIKEKEYSAYIDLCSDNAKYQSKEHSLRSVKSDGIKSTPYETSETQNNTTLQYEGVLDQNNKNFTLEKVGDNKLLTNDVSSTRTDEFVHEHVTQDTPSYRECSDDEYTLIPCINLTRDDEHKELDITSLDECCSDCDKRNDPNSTCQNNHVGDDNNEVTGEDSDDTGCDQNLKHVVSTTRNEESDNEKLGGNMKVVSECSDDNLLTIGEISTRLDGDNGQRMTGVNECCDNDGLLTPIVSSTRHGGDKDRDMTGGDECFSADISLTPGVNSSRPDDDKDQNMSTIDERCRDCYKRKCTSSTCQIDQVGDDDTVIKYENDDNGGHCGHFKYDDNTKNPLIKPEKSAKNAEGARSEDVILADLQHFNERCEKEEKNAGHDDRGVENIVDRNIDLNHFGKTDTTIMARAMKDAETVSLSRRTKKCPDLWIPFSEEGLFGRQCNKVKPDTPYPSQLPVLSLNVPSGVFGDSLKPPGTNQEDILPGTDTPMTVDNISRLNRYSAELNCTPAITGQLKDTPRFSSVITEIGMRPLSGTVTNTSNSSGRKNPLAKVDSEVRDLERAARARIFEGTLVSVRSARRPLPPIHSDERFSKETSAVCRRREPTGKKNEKNMSDTQNMDRRARVKRKPAVPRVLKSSVCYQEGKVDVSIYTDGRVLSQNDPVHLNINFVRQPLRVVTPTGSAKSKAVGQQKEEHVSKRPANGVKECMVNHQLRPTPNTKTYNHFEKNPRKGLMPIKNPPTLKVKTTEKRQQFSAKKAKSRKMSNISEDIQQKSRVSIWNQSCDSLDWNIVERRAKKPPFNTHIDPEASYRHRQFFMDY